jgi:predicted AlkP superfamily pyrophosphatase or phosphodiesterase
MKCGRIICLAVLAGFCSFPAYEVVLAGTPAKDPGIGQKPKLVLQIVVDQLRGDLPLRYVERLGEGGLRYLLNKGTYYNNAHYQHANTETVVGHTILATGAFPSRHGMVANAWFDRENGRMAYNVGDKRFPVLATEDKKKENVQVDPAQMASKASGTGRSPKAILSSTLSDEMVVSNGGKSRAFAVSVKDRGAIPLAGHAGKAFWFSKNNGGFVTSSYYYPRYPEWVEAWNSEKLADQYSGKFWKLLHDQSTYVFGESDDRPYESDVAGFGRTFPHPYGDRSSKYFYTLLSLSPVADKLLLDFAKDLIENEKLGQGAATDYLGISFSSPDYVAHIFGPSSLEAEDNLLQLDRTLADLFKFIDTTIGLENTLIVLSADHGGAEAPEYMAGLGMDTGRITPSTIDVQPVTEALKKRFGIGKQLIQAYQHPYIYLNREAIAKKGLEQKEVERALAKELMKIPGIALAVPTSDLLEGDLPDSPVIRQVRRSFHPKRSGDIYLIQNPHWFLYTDSSIPLCAMHGSPWTYDTYVPIFFAGGNIPAQRISRRVHPVDIAPTIAAFLGIKPPSGAIGDVLVEVVDQGSKN